MNRREDGKDCIAKKGIENYEFDLEIELNKYKYLCGEKLNKKQWKTLKNEDRYETYDNWKRYIEQRYANYPVCMLNELYRYLIHRKRRLYSFFNFINPYIGAIYSVTFAFVSSLLMEISKIEVISDNIVFKIILAILIYFGICYLIIYVCTEGLHLSSEHSIKEGLLTDYLEIIEEIIKKREGGRSSEQKHLILIGSPGSLLWSNAYKVQM